MYNNYLFNASAAVCAFLCLLLLLKWRKSRKGSLPFPPGPKGLPIIGNLYDMPPAEAWYQARKWGEIYGPVVHLRILGSSYIFLNSYQSAVDLLEKRGSKYSSRPTNTMFELEGWGWLAVMMRYGEELRKVRQILHRFLQPGTVDDYMEVQIQSTHKLLEGLLKRPDAYPELIQHSAGEIILKMTYGYTEKDDSYVALAEKGAGYVKQSEEFLIVNAFPWLQYLPSWLPGAGFKNIAKEGYKVAMDMLWTPHERAKAELLNGTAIPSISSKLMEENMKDNGVLADDALIAKSTGVMYAGGTDTTVSALHSFFLAMLLYPEVQRHAHDEIDAVIGKDTLPTFEDKPNLPYIGAIVKETLRWELIAPFGFPHLASEDDEYDGYRIPAGAIILPNYWAMVRDPVVYTDPDNFIPERWLPSHGKKAPLEANKIVFGIGRRICPGRHFAENHMFIAIASILSAFNITKALDENGTPITPEGDYTPTFVRHPKPFKYVITPRSEKIVSSIHHAVDSSK